MKYELTHDILARKIEERVSADDKYRRRVREFIRDRYDFYVKNGELLTETALDYIKPHKDTIKISDEEHMYIEESIQSLREQQEAEERKKEEERRIEQERKDREREAERVRQEEEKRRLRKQLMYASIAIVVILSLLITSIFYYKSAKKEEDKALDFADSIKTQKEQLEVQKDSLQIRFFANQIYLGERELARENFDSAKAIFQRALPLALNKDDSNRVESNLAKIEGTTIDIFRYDRFMREAKKLKDQERFDEAIANCQAAASLGSIDEGRRQIAYQEKCDLILEAIEYYDALNDILIQSNKPEEAEKAHAKAREFEKNQC